ncbi:MAG: hypothetical protein JWR40_2881 [Massilia sp.]|jgi:hypothetical protein|nr:hypothetical protein [Massilia sp.]
MPIRRFPLFAALFAASLLGAGVAGAVTADLAPDGEWVSYRDAYRAMVVFEKYGGPKHLIQNHFQVMRRAKAVSTDGLRLALIGKSPRLNLPLNLPLDPLGRAVFPLLKAAYDDNAALVLNRKLSQYVLRPRVSILVRPDGVYEAAELRAACDQALGVARYADASARALNCAGVRFGFARNAGTPVVRLREGREGRDRGLAPALPVGEAAIFADDPDDGFKTVLYRFAGTPARGQVVTQDAPLAIAPVFE